MGGDDSKSASELRKRYQRGGEAKDSDLGASQLRARYAIKSNHEDFSTRHKKGTSTSPAMIGSVAAGLVAMALLYVFLFAK